MGDDLTLRERACARTAMQWSDEPLGGFTKNAKPHIPVIDKGTYGYQHINTAVQRRDPESMLNWTNSVLFLHNLHEQPREILVDPGVSSKQGKLLVNLLAENHSRANKSGKHRIMLEGYGYRWYRIGGLDYLLRRTDIDQSDSHAG